MLSPQKKTSEYAEYRELTSRLLVRMHQPSNSHVDRKLQDT